ncbi:hypothetical protein MRX96_015937 [Rhipicephalus microplus]
MRKGTHVSSVPLSWRRSGLLLQASGRCPTSSWTRLLGVENSFEDRFDPVTPSVSSGNTRLSAASSCRSYLLQCLSVAVMEECLVLRNLERKDPQALISSDELSFLTEPDGAAARAHVRSRKTDPFSVDVLESGSIQSPRRTRTLLKGSRNRAYRRNRQDHICGKTYRLPRRHVPAKRKMPGATSVRPEEAGPRGPWRRCHVWRDAVTDELVQDEGGVAINDTPFPPDLPVTE